MTHGLNVNNSSDKVINVCIVDNVYLYLLYRISIVILLGLSSKK